MGQIRSSHRYVGRPQPVQGRLSARVIALAKEYGRYGYRTVTDLLRQEGWDVGTDRVYTIWRHEGLQVPQKQPKRARLWRAEGAGLSSSVKRDSQQDDKRIISSLYFATPTAASFAFIDLVRFYVGMGEL